MAMFMLPYPLSHALPERKNAHDVVRGIEARARHTSDTGAGPL